MVKKKYNINITIIILVMQGFTTVTENPTEQDMLELAIDCKNRIEKKNIKISQLTKTLFMLYGLIRRGLEIDDPAFFEESRSVLSEFLLNEYDLEQC